MRELKDDKVFAQYRDTINPYEPVIGRKYTITHSDITADLFVYIASDYAEDKVSKMRDEVRISWTQKNRGFILTGSVLVDGKGVIGNPFIRNKIFYNEMPTALQALRRADRFLFEKYPTLDNSPVLIHFISNNPNYDKTYNFKTIGDYK
ncbi:hypothetical protein SDC9_126527 [bioreactor metagenome]|uniref:Staygreen protein domain-containing protein n=1 Tax=bioreactor metagenome TaxID=1076179 RepID=A0A645CQW6_9ZZZZ|nr:staygreen family protein [Oscillospiraceae bacterium]